MNAKNFFFSFLLLLSLSAAAQIDVQHYAYEMELTDHSDTVKGKATVTIKFLEDAKTVQLDLKSPASGKGMLAYKAMEKETPLSLSHTKDKLAISLLQPAHKEEVRTFDIYYAGIPADGLIISKNKFGDRTFFADNWPNRARYWIPCHDTPDDKASVEFKVTAPAHYQIVSNGIKVEETDMGNGKKVTHWKEDIPLPTKVMVIGAARFAVARLDSASCLPVTAWIYPQEKQKGFYDYALANRILAYFTGYIAPFPFRKLANVQSKTIFGGMENAGAIFYTETSVRGDRSAEDLMAHEIAHQWFGDMATEKSFAHLWLSEGFATYMTDLYLEHQYGRTHMEQRLQNERQQVIAFSKTNQRPVVDSTTDLMSLLNANSYQKGGWVLHMLRNEVGDSMFQKIIQTYYQQYKGRNAETRDFEKVAEDVSGKELKWFFDQWLYQPRIPKLDISWAYNSNQTITFYINQSGDMPFRFPLEIAVTLDNGQTVVKKYEIKDLMTIIRLSLKSKPVKVVVDPNTNLLFDGVVSPAQ